MTHLGTVIRTALLLTGILLAAPNAQAESAAAARRIIADGKPAVLIVSHAATNKDLASEAYADWAACLNEFVAEQRETFRFVRITPKDLKAIFGGRAPVTQPFATVFIRNASGAIYYDGMIHEPAVYRAAAEFLSGTDDPRAAALGLKPFPLRLR
jgi:hypothetical protein